MAELTQEQFDQVPEFLQGDYERVGEGYQHKSEGKVGALKTSLDALDGKFKGVEAQLREAGDNQIAAIEKAKSEALEAAKTSGDVAEVEKKFTEMMADLEARKNGEMDALRGENEALSNTNKNSKRQSVLADLRSKLGVFDDSHKHFDALVGPQIDIDAKTGAITYLDDAGSATSLDDAGFLSTLKDDSAFGRMRKAEASGSGGFANGNSNTGGGAPTKSQAAEAAKSKGDLNGFLQASLKSN